MKTEGHLEKARAFEERARRWESDREAPSVIEGVVNDRLATPPAEAGGMSASLRSAGGSPLVCILDNPPPEGGGMCEDFNAAVHFIACGINQKHGKDIDSHAAQKRFLRDSDEDGVLDAFEALENIRIASVYGGAWNGDRIARALELLEVIKKWTGTGRPPD